jgi:hypothetical protein
VTWVDFILDQLVGASSLVSCNIEIEDGDILGDNSTAKGRNRASLEQSRGPTVAISRLSLPNLSIRFASFWSRPDSLHWFSELDHYSKDGCTRTSTSASRPTYQGSEEPLDSVEGLLLA